ncbi:hypothetical protein [Schumannella sp. 10F1B-5-1]|uniref:hypothetical protein n=1 Tax=Schumannella sp. 10F1B-5-1 TaxID=2590780 RepID=UPI00113209EF|nr:hypothetical protein [Schumannella sp. 10F1B-5-1]TPW70762.1 hypothetical protein FJ658_11570 [Schumannella sp. 10F1B-5-1]
MRAAITAWARRNGLALGVLVVTAGAMVWLVGFEPLLPSDSPAQRTQRVATGDSIEQQGSTFEVTKAGFFTRDSDNAVDVPAGYALLGVLLPITPGADAAAEPGTCDIRLVAPRVDGGRGDRTWTTVVNPAQYDYGLSTGTTTYCTFSDDGDKAVFEGVFLVPDDVYDEARVQVTFTAPKAEDFRQSIYLFELPSDPLG